MGRWKLIIQAEDNMGYTVERFDEWEFEPDLNRLEKMLPILYERVKAELEKRYWNS